MTGPCRDLCDADLVAIGNRWTDAKSHLGRDTNDGLRLDGPLMRLPLPISYSQWSTGLSTRVSGFPTVEVGIGDRYDLRHGRYRHGGAVNRLDGTGNPIAPKK
jgi:hypothetical protein